MPGTINNHHKPHSSHDHQFLKSDAIILRLHDYSETSYVVSLLTREHGRLNALAKGGRRPKTVFDGELDLLAEGEAVVLMRSQGLHLLTEFACRDMHADLRQSLERVAAAWYAAGIAADVSPEAHPHPEIFDLLKHTLHILCRDAAPANGRTSRPATSDIAAGLITFQVHLLTQSGTMPDFSSCAGCSTPIDADSIHYCFSKSGPLCAECRQSAGRTREVSRGAISLFASIGRSSPTARRKVSIATPLAREGVEFLGQIIASAFDQDLSSLNTVLELL